MEIIMLTSLRSTSVFLSVLLAATGLLVPDREARAAAPVSLSMCTFDSNRNVTIGGSGGCGPDVYVDQSYTGTGGLGVITIASGGTLVFDNKNGRRKLDTSGIVVNGTLKAGSSAHPIASNNAVTINFTDARAVATVTKGITVNAGGSLMLFGKTGVVPAQPPVGSNPQAPSWTYLAAPAGPSKLYGTNLGVASPVAAGAATTLQLSDTVDWQPGQWIVVAGTDFSPDSAEFVRISTVNCQNPTTGACTVTLDAKTPLVTYHYGGPAPDSGAAAFNDGVTQNYGVDERAEVGLVSRNIKLTATITGSDTANGGEIKIMKGFNEVSIQGVEIEKFGKDKVGSYPIHFHEAGTVTAGTVLVDSNSIHHSYNKCVTLHATNGVTISNNVCARAVGHLYFLEMGTETNDAFINNLGIGAMSNAFLIPQIGTPPNLVPNAAAIAAFWSGDYLANDNGYNGFNVAFTDTEGTSPVNGAANTASGFWITNLGGNTFTGNSIAGCQAVGRGFWILPGNNTPAVTAAIPPGGFANNRAHGCYTGFDTASDNGVTGALNYTPQGACLAGSGATGANCDIVAEFDGLTATRNRNRGIWVRASWYAIKQARLATNRDSVSLVSSGGTEGSPPGEWSLLKDAIIVGISANNPLRFGPCPYSNQNSFGGSAGCYEPVQGNGYPAPSWNFAGMMFYDGPARLENVKFVNFNKDITPYLTAADLSYLNYYSSSGNTIPGQPNKPFVYEGDAAMGWFQSNVNSYPPTQYVKELSYVNVDLRHQVYTQDVGPTAAPSGTGSNFRDGDKFTVILDRDQSLTGLQVVSSGTNPSSVPDAYPISLNNLPFLAGPGTVDECLSTGQQDQALEGRPTSLISPYSYATLEFSALTAPCNGVVTPGQPNCQNNNVLVFTKDQKDYGGNIQFTDTAIDSGNTMYAVNCGGTAGASDPGVPGHACVALSGRNGNGIYEPKVVNGLGYTVGASAGIPNFVSLMYTDAKLPNGISATNPFHTRVGICYKNENMTATPDASAFKVYKGGKSFASPNNNLSTLSAYFSSELQCAGLDNVMCGSGTTATPFCYTTLCPYAPTLAPTPVLPPPLPSVSTIADLDDPAQCPNGECYFYDSTSGLLFLNVVQEQPNAGGPYSSPLGSCAGTKDADGICADKSFYSCPGPGCELYTIQVDSSYAPGSPSACTPYGGSGGAVDYKQPYPSDLNQLAYSNKTPIQTALHGANGGFPHNELTKAPKDFCPTNAPTQPDWPPAPKNGEEVFTLALPANVTATIQGVAVIPGTSFVLLTPGTTYLLSATNSNSGSSCSQNFTVNQDGTGFTSTGANWCQLGASGNTTISPAAGPYDGSFTLKLPSKVTATIQGVTMDSRTQSFLLSPGQTYTLSATSKKSNPSSSCSQNFTINQDGNGFTSAGSNLCQMGTSGNTILSPGQGPYQSRFTLSLPANVTATIKGVTVNPKTSYVLLSPGQTYLLSATSTNPPASSCSQKFTVSANGIGFTSSSNNCCQMGTSSPTNNIGPGAGPYSCEGP
ncbi:MAG: hypothetical protein EPO18_11770 [Methylobacter sp.]|nr:MAG: hypothetical protein EPO18_11770 [Methylobacter sp.]